VSETRTWSLELTTPLGADQLSLESLQGSESLSEPFLFEISMVTDQDTIDASALVGKPAHVTLVDGEGNKRYIHGLVTRFGQDEHRCTAELRPWLWMLSLASDCRIFQSKAVPDILTAVFGDCGQTDYRNDLVLSYPTLDYCVQFQETSFQFVNRLMEEAGIAYYFEHSESAHTLVMIDDPSKYPACPHGDSLPYLPLPDDRDWLTDSRIGSADLSRRVASAAFQTDDYNFVTPSTELKAKAGNGSWQIYEYPGRYTTKNDGDTVAKRRMEEIEALAKQLSGTSPVRHMTAGATFTMTNHPSDTFNGKYALYSVSHSARRREYGNVFTAFPADVPFRPPRRTPRPRLVGAQTAIVVGPSGKEVWTDQYGRVKVQFHWDQNGNKDENSSCWIRVAQNWAGTSWGAFALPRIGQEVLVSFLDADPDRPLVTGCVYNGDNPVPYTLPDEQTKTTLKSNSSQGGGGFNEIRFEDKKDSEELFIQAQKDFSLNILHDRTETVDHDGTVTVKNDRTETIDHDDTITVKNNRTLTVSEGNATFAVSKGNETHSVEGTRSVTVTSGETHSNKADFSQDVGGNFTLQVTGDITIKASGAITIEAGTSLTLKAGMGLTAQAGTSLSLSGGTTMELKASASGTVDGGGLLNVKGGLVKLN
jgi:type VI secretion system secreted protein VgrG